MSLLKDFTDFLDRNFDTPAEVVQRTAQGIDQRLESAKALLGETIEYAAPEGTRRRTVLDKMAQAQRAVGAGLSTAALLTDKQNPAYKDGFQISDIAETYRGPAQQISPTQALFGASDLPPFNLPRQALNVAEDLGVNVPTGGRRDFDIYNEEQRRKAFDEELVGKWSTGASDFMISWYADPFVVGSEVGALAKGKYLTPKVPLNDIEGIAKVTSTKGASAFIDFALRTDATGIYKHPFAQKSSNPDAVAGIFGDINVENYGTRARPIAENTLKALYGDEKALKFIEKEAASISDIIDRISTKEFKSSKNKTKLGIQRLADLTSNGDVNAMLLNNAELGLKYDDILKDTKIRNAALRSVLTRVQDNIIESPFVGTRAIAPSPSSLVENFRAKVAETKTKTFLNDRFTEKIDGLEWTNKTFKSTAYDYSVRVLGWSGLQQPSGWVPFKGIASSGSGDELIAFMDKVKPWRTDEGTQLKRKLLNQYFRAQTDADRIVIITKIENQAVKAINKELGLDRKLTSDEANEVFAKGIKKPDGSGPATTLSDMIKYELDQRRNSVLEHYRTKLFAYSDGEWVFTDPVLSSQLGDAMPMLDIKLYQEFAASELKTFVSGFYKAKSFLKASYFAFDAVWRPATLLRFAYPQRNVIEGEIRTALYNNSLLEIGMGLAKGSKNFANNFYHGVVGNRIEKFVIAKELGLPAPKTMLGSWKSIVRWQKNDLEIIRTKHSDVETELKIQESKLSAKIETKTKINEERTALNAEKTRIEKVRKEIYELLNKEEIDYGKYNTLVNQIEAFENKIVAFENKVSRRQKTLDTVKSLEEKITTLRKELKPLTEQLEKQQEFYGTVLDAVNKTQQKLGGKANKYTQGKEDIVVGDLIFQGYKSGSLGSIGPKLASAAQKQKKEIRNPLMQGEKYTSYGWKQLNPDNPNYYASLYVQARQMREAEVTKRMLQIDTSLGKRHVVSQLNKIKKWFVSDDRLAQIEFRNTKVQKELVLDTTKKLTRKEKKAFAIRQEKRRKSKYDIDNYISERWNAVQTTFPDQSLRFDIANRPYEKIPNAYELESRLGQLQIEGKLSPISGEAIGTTKLRGIEDIPKVYAKSVDTLFKYLGSMPEDAFTRVTFYGNVYEKAVNTGGNALILKAQRRGKPATELEIASVERAAHREALRETKRVLYTVERYSNLASLGAFFSPFIQAQLNSLRVYSNLLLNNPKPIIRPTQIWNDEWNKEAVDKDPQTGEPLITMQVPNSWRNTKLFNALASVSFPITRLNIPFSGEPWWNAGAGPIIQIGASNLVNAVPYLDAKYEQTTGSNLPIRRLVDQYVLPYGSSKEFLSYDMLLPAWTKRGVSATRKLDDGAFLTTANKILAIENQKFRDGSRTDEATPNEIVDKTVWHFMLRLGINQALAVIPNLSLDYKQYFDIYRSYTEKYGIETADAMFYENYPEYYEMITTSPTKNTTGAEATAVSAEQLVKHRVLVAKIQTEDPFVTTLISNAWGVDRENNVFDRAAYNFQLKNKPASGGDFYRETISLEQSAKNAKVDTGWQEYNKFMQAFDIKVQQNGFDSYSSSGASFLKEERKAWIEEQKTINPTWFNEYDKGLQANKYKGTLRAIDIVLSDKAFTESDWFKSDPTFKALEEYMIFRQEVVDYLAESGSQSIDAESNLYVKEEVDKKVRELKDSSPKFGLWYDRFLEKDKFGDLNVD
jgi:hypothetical protein